MSTPPDREFRPHPRPALIGNEGEGCLLCLKAANVVLELRASEAMFLEAHPLAPHGLPLVSRKHIARCGKHILSSFLIAGMTECGLQG